MEAEYCSRLQSAYNFYDNGRHFIRIVYSIGLAGELCWPCIIIQMDASADNTEYVCYVTKL